jgi:hypothetical protein
MKIKSRFLVTCVLCFLAAVPVFAGEKKQRLVDVEYTLDVSPVWSGQPAEFCLLTKGNNQYVAYYDQAGQMTVASRTLDVKEWKAYQIPQTPNLGTGNYRNITMAIDDNGYLHLSGNMHGTPLIYFRSSLPYDIYSLERIQVIGWLFEDNCTFPQFMRGPEGELVFRCRVGNSELRGWCSSDSNEVYNVYKHDTRAWIRITDPLTTFITGNGEMRGLYSLESGPDGYYHMFWVWRDKPDCSTYHDVSYVRSKHPLGLIQWETIKGTEITRNPIKSDNHPIAITIDKKEAVVDPVPVNGGLINRNTKIGFDSKKRPVISYTKFDKKGKTQVYNARLEGNQWKIYQTSDWNYRWVIKGPNPEKYDIEIDPVEVTENGLLIQSYRHVKLGSGTWHLDAKTLKPIGEIEMPLWPEKLNKLQDKTKGMQVNWSKDTGESDEKNTEYVLRWETLPTDYNSGNAKAPAPSSLKVLKLKYQWK